MRVLILVENLPVPFDRRVWQEACALRDAGHEVTVICPQMRGYTQPAEVLEGIQIYRHWITGEAGSLGGFIAEYASALWGELTCALKAWRRGGFDVIHLCNPPDLLFLVALPFKLFCGVKVIFDVHDLWPEMFEAKFGKRGLMYWAVRAAERCTLALADVVIATNQSVLSAVKQRGKLSEDRAFVVRTAPSRMHTAAQPDEALRAGRRHLVGYIGVMGNADGVDYLVRAADHVVKTRQRTDVQFLLMGSGAEHADLVALRDQLGLSEYLSMPGRVSDEFLCRALRTIDLGVACDPINAYNDHCTMNKVLEYMAFAKPMVMFGTVEGRFSAGESAVYVMENSPEKLGDAILALLDDESRRQTLGAAGHARLSQELNWERSVVQLLAAYQAA
ncbi:glycosyltransferase family 4 protein [Prosthecobacter sp.]|uniref:glycosyltransferase family 4 protein n=1 Tax=Prosthecobacter sp. TaxID=1965333 RepID=UPI003783E4BD